MPEAVKSTGLNENYLQGYLAWLLGEKRYSKLTAQSYARDLSHLFELSTGLALADIRVNHIRRYIAQLHSSGLGGRTLARMLSAWRSFYNYLLRDHGFSDNPCVGLRAPKSARALPHALSPDQAVRMAGYDDAQIVEIVQHVALNTWTNYLNSVAQTEIDFPVAQAVVLVVSLAFVVVNLLVDLTYAVLDPRIRVTG